MAYHSYLSQARYVDSRIVSALRDCKRNPVFREFIITERNEHVILFAVLDELQLGEPVSLYMSDEVLHQISTLANGRRVAISNHNGVRYAVLLSTPPGLPGNVPYPQRPDKDVFPLGVGRRGFLHQEAARLLNILVGGASRSGKSNFLLALAFTGLQNGYNLYLADPQEITFASAWDSLCAAPVASSKSDFLRLLATIQQEMVRRGNLFKNAVHPGGLPVQKIEKYNQVAPTPLPRSFFIIDEANTFMDQRGVSEAIADIARQSLKYGIHLVIVAHSWRAQNVPRSLSASFATRISFRVNHDTSASVVLDSNEWGRKAMKLSWPGRGLIRLDGGKPQEFQAYYLPDHRLADLLAAGKPMQAKLLTEMESSLVQRSLAETGGRMTQEDLISWGLAPKQARRLGESWELKGWLAQVPSRWNARYITPVLREIVEADG
jgi:hypothetical protein